MQRTIEHLTHKWHLITWQVIELRPTPSTKIRELVKETYSVLHSLQKQELVPRAASALIYEMTEFVWWVGDLEGDTATRPLPNPVQRYRLDSKRLHNR